MKFTLIHPSRSRPKKSVNTMEMWMERANDIDNIEVIISLDTDDPKLYEYTSLYGYCDVSVIANKNRSCVDAINNAANICTGDIIIVVSDDSDCKVDWDVNLLVELKGKSDYILKTKDGIQDYIVTLPILDRTYYNRDGYIYHPDYFHQFCDTFMTCVADMRGRLLFSNLDFPHLHYSYSGGKEVADALNHRNDLTWKDGQDTFVKLMKQFSVEERNRIKNKSMRSFMKHVGL